MRGTWLLAMFLFLGGCSCGRQPDAEPVAIAPASSPAPAITQAPLPVPQPGQSEAAATGTETTSLAASTLHAYLAEVAGKNWGKADTYWTGGKPPPRADDFAVREVEDLRSMRINNDPPRPLDQENPPRAVEIPVTLRIRKDAGVYEISGWYRLRMKVAGDGWEITSASLQPSMQ